MSRLSEWYEVSYDKTYVYRNVNPPKDGEAWDDKFRWEDIIIICFNRGDYMITDEIYIFTNQREESYVIPTECEGGAEFWGEIVRRELFDPQLAIDVAIGKTDDLVCWDVINKKIKE
jgi:hypothetical protein